MTNPAVNQDMPTSAHEARASGASMYFTGKPCKHGHVAPRYTRGQCTACNTHHKRNRDLDKHAAAERARYAADPDKMRKRSRDAGRKHRAERKEHRNAYLRQWSANNTDASKSIKARYRQNNPEQGRLDAQRRRCRLKGVDGSFTRIDIVRITERQEGLCACCGSPDGLTIDHIVPISKGGSNWPSNLQMLCRPCNSKKQARDNEEFMSAMGVSA